MTTGDELYRAAVSLKGFIDQQVPGQRLTGSLPDISQDYVKLQDEIKIIEVDSDYFMVFHDDDIMEKDCLKTLLFQLII